MSSLRTLLRQPSLVLIAFVMVLFGGFAAWKIAEVRAAMQAQVARELTEQITDRVTAWEDQLLEQTDQWIENAAANPPAAGRLQTLLRRRQPWVDSVYLWIPNRQLTLRGEHVEVRGTFLFPPYAPTEDTERLHAHPCLANARELWRSRSASTADVADAFVRGCSRQDVGVRLVASTEAAALLASVDRYDDALAALSSSGLSHDLPITLGIEQGLPPFRVVINRTQRGQLLMALGREDDALDLYLRTGLEVAALDAPSAENVLTYARWPILAELRQHGRPKEAQRLERELERAERRVQAWQEVRERIVPRIVTSTSTDTRFVYDQYAETPFLLFYRPVRDGEMGAGLALDQPAVLSDLLSALQRYRRFLAITDLNGELVSGVRSGGATLARIPLSRTLTHLQIVVRQSALDSELGKLPNQWLLPAIFVIFGYILGFYALIAQARATENQALMLQRQRDFTTRVTHELKTPLAGIRVMAENIELGAFRDDAHRTKMAVQIQAEADRLTQRIDEVLSVARERTLPKPEPFDPEEAALLCIEDWGPRLERAGITLEADLQPTDEVLGDMEATRDAVACLLDNALKYADEGKEDRRVWLNITQVGQRVVFEVVDNGLGVPPDKREAIFERFVRVEGPNRGKAGGHGLGLAQVAAIAKAQGGSIRCDEGVDGGARFLLTLPVA